MLKLLRKLGLNMKIFLTPLFVILSRFHRGQDPWQTSKSWILNQVQNNNRKIKNIRGFTIAELLIATVILGILLLSAGAVYSNFFNSYRNLKAANLVYEEARFTMEKIVKEARKGTIDYEEYFNQSKNNSPSTKNETYGKNYCEYSTKFYDFGKDGQPNTYDDINRGTNSDAPAINTPMQNHLFLINANGDQRTYIKLIKKRDKNGDLIGKVGILKLKGEDFGSDNIKSNRTDCKKDAGEGDGLIDTWMCESGYNCTPESKRVDACVGKIHTIYDDSNATNPESSFIDITPSTLDIVDLKFFITPSNDPHKAYADASAQIQPHVTIKLIAKANKKLVNKFQILFWNQP